MSEFLNSIKLFLYNNELMSLSNFNRKIEYLKLSNINLYDQEYLFKSNLFLEPDIIEYIASLKYILKYDFTKDYINIKDITSDNYVIKDFGVWYSNNDYTLDNNSYLNNFLDLVLDFYERFKIIDNNFIDPVFFYNSSKIKPYIINIDLIVNKLVELTINKGI